MKTSYFSYSHFSKLSTALLLAVSSIQAFALSPAVEQFVKWETQGNAVSTRSSESFAIKHFEIPLSALQSDFAKYLDADVKDALVFKKNGEDYVRWIINPEDTKWHKELEAHLISKGMDTTQYSYFTAYHTASRSMIFEDPKTHAQFSAKVSTNQTGGMWKDKKQGIEDAKQVRMVSDLIHDTAAKTNFDRVVIQTDPLQLGAEAVDQALIVRSLADLPKGDHFYLPGFSAVHEQVGADIARMNGSTNPAQFWNENYNKPLAEAIAEMSAHFGLTYDSPHSQNFLVELDRNMKPTGRIVLRDFGDSYVQDEFLKALGHGDFLKNWEQGNITRGNLNVAVGIMHGNTPPSWLSERDYKTWGVDFYKAFEAKFSSLTGVPTEELATQRIGYQAPFSYFSKNYNVRSAAWQNYLKMAQCFAGSPVTKEGLPCPDHLLKRLKASSAQSEIGQIAKSEVDNVAAQATRAAQNHGAAPKAGGAKDCATSIGTFFGALRAAGR